MHRFFIKEPIADTVTLRGEDVKHISRVLRLRDGDAITLCDGRGSECVAKIESITKDAVCCRCTAPIPCAGEPRTKVTIYQGLPKTGKMETIVQKCVELGVDRVVPMLTDRCVVQPKESFQSRIERWQRVSEEAAKQSQRGTIPIIEPLVVLKRVDLSQYDLALVAYENEQTVSLKEALKAFSGTKIALLIGPEGGFEQAEIEHLVREGAQSVSLGTRILRTETAGMAMLAQVLYEVET